MGKQQHKRLCFIPLDARPVCYDQPRRLAAIAGLELDMPSPKLLGHLKQPADFKAMKRWIKNHLFENAPVIAGLDTLAYGGLIPSRVGHESLSEIDQRLDEFFAAVKSPALFAFSSIMRIPNYDIDEEEPTYWKDHGSRLYEYSVSVHRDGNASPDIQASIPETVLTDFLSRRERNLTVNLAHIARLKNGQIHYLTLCQDDTGPFGINVQEAEHLKNTLDEQNVTDRAHIQTGADEVACCMLTRWYSENHGANTGEPVRIYPVYSSQQGPDIMARFDGVPIREVVAQKIRACGATESDSEADADLILLVHTPFEEQGDHCENKAFETRTQPKQHQWVLDYLGNGFAEGKRVMLADIAHANGSDPELTEQLICRFDDITGLYGYAGWNTPGNTVGTALSMGMMRYLAELNEQYHPDAFNQLMMIRLGDDWFYQANVRYTIRQETNGGPMKESDETRLNLIMANGLELIQNRLGLEDLSVRCRFPCQRSFEVEIALW